MRSIVMFLVLQFLVATSTLWAQSGDKERVIGLKDGGRIVVRADGTMSHYDSSGNPVAMPEGVVMVAADGNRIMMKRQALWREIVEIAARSYAQASVGANIGSGAPQRSIELKDGGRISVRADGTMAHFDATGQQLRMAEGEMMTAKDGSQILMVNGSLWTPGLIRDPPQSTR
jgi:hypothetical protein